MKAAFFLFMALSALLLFVFLSLAGVLRRTSPNMAAGKKQRKAFHSSTGHPNPATTQESPNTKGQEGDGERFRVTV